jgi:ABC-type multidrug transport system fused ATPase/permease subunit
VRFTDATISWTTSPILKDLSFDFQGPQSIAIIGRVGCGKSTLLNAIMRESFTQSGLIECSERVSYAEQNPLIISGNVRTNILYGSYFDKNYYNQVIKACQLEEDFQNFPNGDLTKTGEMGITLSGG